MNEDEEKPRSYAFNEQWQAQVELKKEKDLEELTTSIARQQGRKTISLILTIFLAGPSQINGQALSLSSCNTGVQTQLV